MSDPINTTINTANAFTPDDFGQLLVATASKQSVGMQVTTVVTTSSTEFRIPLVAEEVDAGWYAEGADLTLDDATLAEEVVRPRKVAGFSKLSNELASDSSPAAAGVIGESIARSIATKIDAALFGLEGGAGVPPKGIGAILDGSLSLVTAGAAWANIDAFVEAQFAVATAGGEVTAFIANPADAETLAKLKRATGSNEPLLAPDANSATKRSIAGVELHVSPAVPAGTVYAIDKSRIFTVLRDDVSVEMDRSVFFGSDSTGVRAVARIGFGYAHPKSIARIVLTAPDWKTATAYKVGDRVTLTGDQILVATVAGTSSTPEPTAPAAAGGSVVDGGVTWVRQS